jgi:hypothetical protein
VFEDLVNSTFASAAAILKKSPKPVQHAPDGAPAAGLAEKVEEILEW